MTTNHRMELRSILHQRCPECGEGAIFSSLFRMNSTCPHCGLKYERGPGYFTGAMYFSYGMGIPIILIGTFVLKLLKPDWPLHWLVFLVWIAFLPLVPLIWRYSRTIFMHFDRYFDPDDA